MDSGFAGGDDEVYNVYDKPWRQDKDLAGNLYRPSKNVEKDVYGDDLDKLIKANRFVCVWDSESTETDWFRFFYFNYLLYFSDKKAVTQTWKLWGQKH